jgi:hypothetical protein
MVDESPNQNEIEVPVRFRILPGMASVTAQQLLIHTSPDSVLLSFFEIIPPVILDTNTEEQKKAILQAGVVAECVARVNIPKSKYAEFVNTMQVVLKENDSLSPETK